MEYSIENINGYVKNIPMQIAKIPKMDPIIATISNPKSSKGCFKTTIILDFMASTAFNLPNTINGIVKKVTKEIVNEIRVPIMFNPANSRRVESTILTSVIINTALKIFEK